jgi:excinuclease ABC subunit C
MMLELDRSQEFNPRQDEQFFQAVPESPGILLIEMCAPSAHAHLVRTADLRRAAERLLRPAEPGSRRLNLREVAARIRYRLTGSKFEQTFALYQHARANFPDRYRDLLHLRPAALLKVNLRNDYPRCYVTRRLGADGGFYFGPFASRRAADAFSEGFLDLFKIRRCQIKIRRDPSFPGCIYSEMKMCLAPCFAGCTKQEYDAEVGRVLDSLDTAGEALRTSVEREREAASEALDFERAAALHKRLEKVSAALRGLPELARRIEDLDAVILQRAVQEKTIAVFPLHAGILGEPSFLDFAELSSQPHSVEAILREKLKPPVRAETPGMNQGAELGKGDPEPAKRPESTADWRASYGLRAAPKELAEHLSLVTRWFYSKPREGEVLFYEDEWPYRRILRACGRLLAPGAPASAEAPQGDRVRKFLPES